MPLLDKWNIMGVQLKSGPGGAGNTVIPGPNHCEGVAMTSVPQEKECSRCGERKVLGDFYRSSASRDGRQSYCKTCKKEAYAQYASENQEKIRESFRRWSKDRAEHRSEYLRSWRSANAEAKVEYNRRWREANAERAAEYHRAHRAANADYYRAKKSAYRALVAAATVCAFGADDLDAKLAYWGGRCAYCRSTLGHGFHWDHWKPLSRGGAHSLANLNPACPPCNLSKSAKWPYRMPEVSALGAD